MELLVEHQIAFLPDMLAVPEIYTKENTLKIKT
jgi:hypothetical protein